MNNNNRIPQNTIPTQESNQESNQEPNQEPEKSPQLDSSSDKIALLDSKTESITLSSEAKDQE